MGLRVGQLNTWDTWDIDNWIFQQLYIRTLGLPATIRYSDTDLWGHLDTRTPRLLDIQCLHHHEVTVLTVGLRLGTKKFRSLWLWMFSPSHCPLLPVIYDCDPTNSPALTTRWLLPQTHYDKNIHNIWNKLLSSGKWGITNGNQNVFS